MVIRMFAKFGRAKINIPNSSIREVFTSHWEEEPYVKVLYAIPVVDIVDRSSLAKGNQNLSAMILLLVSKIPIKKFMNILFGQVQ